MMSETRYYMGEASELDGMTRDEVEAVTLDNVNDVEDAYQEMITEIYGVLSIGDLTYGAGYVLREVDPMAFRVGVSDAYEEIDLDDYPETIDD